MFKRLFAFFQPAFPSSTLTAELFREQWILTLKKYSSSVWFNHFSSWSKQHSLAHFDFPFLALLFKDVKQYHPTLIHDDFRHIFKHLIGDMIHVPPKNLVDYMAIYGTVHISDSGDYDIRTFQKLPAVLQSKIAFELNPSLWSLVPTLRMLDYLARHGDLNDWNLFLLRDTERTSLLSRQVFNNDGDLMLDSDIRRILEIASNMSEQSEQPQKFQTLIDELMFVVR